MTDALTFQDMQQHFARLFREQRLLPSFIALGTADYETLTQSLTSLMRPQQRKQQQEEQTVISHLINFVDNSGVRLLCDPTLPQGTISFGYDIRKEETMSITSIRDFLAEETSEGGIP